MLAGTEEALPAQTEGEAEEEMSAIEALLEGLIDYAGLYPPASLDTHSAVRNYLGFQQSKYAFALGRFVVDLNRIEELRKAAGVSIGELRLSVVASPSDNWRDLSRLIEAGLRIDLLEVKGVRPADVGPLIERVPAGLVTYFEVPMDGMETDLLSAVETAGARVKLRMGGVVAESFPPTSRVANTLKKLANKRVAFKATAGLHHSVRSSYRFTYEPESPIGVMHGFLNLFCAAALMYFGGDPDEAERILKEEEATVFQLCNGEIHWRASRWTAGQMGEVRRKFMNSFGSCSFEEPIRDLERLGWL
jgi:hypothetical protein